MLPPGILAWTDPSNNEAFLAGTIAITQNAGTMYAKAQLDKVPFANNIAYVAYPKRISDGARLDMFSGNRWYLLKGSKNREAVADLVRHMQTLPVQERIWQISSATRCPPTPAARTIRSSRGTPSRGPPPRSPSPMRRRVPRPNSPASAGPARPIRLVDSIDASNDHTDMMAEILQGKPVPEVVKNYHNKWVQVYKDFGRKGA